MSRANNNLILEIEQLAFNAWPAAQIKQIDGWRMRYTAGVTRRANSVWANQSGNAIAIEQKLTAVEAFYQAHHLPPRYQICPAAQPADLDKILQARGYAAEDHTNVQTATISRVLSRCIYAPIFRISARTVVNMDWFALQDDVEPAADNNPERETRLQIMQRIQGKTLFMQAYVAQTAVAQIIGVVENNWLGVFSLYTSPAWRGQGAATALMARLLEEGQALGATQTYLQVMAENRKANDLYRRLGYTTQYQYHYSTLPP